MKRTSNLKKTLALFLAMMMALTATAFADWDSFQGNDENNGTTTIGITGTPSTTTVDLPNNGATTGLDVEPLVHGSRIYAFYNGGSITGGDPSEFTDGKVGGARLACVDASASTNPIKWTVQVGDKADNVSQIATPVITADGKTLYGAYTYSHDVSTEKSFSESIPNGQSKTAKFTFTLPCAYNSLQISTGLSNDNWTTGSTTSLSATATITGNGIQPITLTGESYQNQGFSLYYGDYSGGILQAGKYEVSMTVTNNTGNTVTWEGSKVQALVNYWQMFRVINLDSNNVSTDDGVQVETLTTQPTTGSANGYGQASTPLTLSGNNVYFGIYDGDRAYYQYNTSTGNLVKFDPPGDDHFYWAGATVYDGRVYFGSEQGVVYVCSEKTFSQQLGNMYITGGAHIRSSMARKYHTFLDIFEGYYLYFTSQDGKLWRVRISGDSVIMPECVSLGSGVSSVSTPTIVKVSETDCNIYVGYSDANYGSNNGIKMVTSANFQSNAVKDVCKANGPVQSSPVVYRSGSTDYIYFTTNAWNGGGYCFDSTQPSTTPETFTWEVSAGNYVLQGFAMGTYRQSGRTVSFAVFGSDASQLIICK